MDLRKILEDFRDGENDSGGFFDAVIEAFPEAEDEMQEAWSAVIKVLCKYIGHDLVPDHCGIVDHDLCLFCYQRRDSLKTPKIKSDWRDNHGQK